MKRTIAIRRGAGASSRIERFEVECGERTTLLDALELIRTGKAPDLAYRHSCHHGSCGTCAVRLDGREVLACLTPLASIPGEAPLVEPVAGFEAVADAAVDPARLFRSIPEGATHLRAAEPREAGGVPAETPPGAERRVRFEDCIECGCCVSACPVTAADETGDRFRGPAGLTAVRREGINHPARAEEMRALGATPDGTAACERHLECSRVCPRAVYPAKHIELLRKGR
jgi:succinate dehydrogenase / fumarate reductase iron-sulfur subunit